ncbi:MAG TPA: 5-(carboxyamino)imidazole ribonucleotide mutase [Candidatus Dormibacteraeota bacterium]|nr:5-(carboxyamino)imidazole ribonucleotide mutase [Candidatus Dormibacteraeota bacterium]
MVEVGIAVGSRSDLPVIQKCVETLAEMGIESEVRVLSAHRTPALTAAWAGGARERGIKVLIGGAGMAAHLAGALAAHSTLPVIGVPLASGALNGIDSLLSTSQMPPGIPVATVAIGEAGAKNAAYLAAQIIGLTRPEVAARYQELRDGFVAAAHALEGQ